MLKRWKLTIEYQGTPYAGWQRQEEGIPSVQQKIEEAITAFCQQECRLHVAGRTDAGVHAQGQVAHFDLDYGDRPLDGFSLTMALNAHLRKEPIAIVMAQEVGEDFHARFSASGKLYTYRLLNRAAPPSFEHRLVWHYRRFLDVGAMREAAAYLLGTHDFSSFRAAECQAKSPIKTLDVLDIESFPLVCGGQELRFLVKARSFLHHQVRNMVGTLALVGDGKWTPLDVKAALESTNRAAGGPTAPPDGLYLTDVYYDGPVKTGAQSPE